MWEELENITTFLSRKEDLRITFFTARVAQHLTLLPYNRANGAVKRLFKFQERSIVQYCTFERAGQEFKFSFCTLSNLLPNERLFSFLITLQ